MKKILVTTFNVVMLALLALVLVSCTPDEPNVETFIVTFDADNGTNPVLVTVDKGDKVTKPTTDPTKAGYTFDEWFLGDKKYEWNKPVTKDITLKAHYNEVSVDINYTVSFDTVGGNSLSAKTVKTGTKVTAPTDPSKEYFSFQGWMLNGTTYSFDTPVTKDITLTANYSYIGIPASETYRGRVFNSDFDQLLNDFSGNEIVTEMFDKSSIASDQPYISIGYSGTIGNNPDGALYKQAGSQNAESAAFQYLVLRLRGSLGASVHDLSIGFRLDDNHEILVVPLAETLNPDQELNEQELTSEWFNYVISITDTLDGRTFVGKTGFNDVEAGGTLVGFHLMNTSVVGSGVLQMKDAYFSKVPNPEFPYEGTNYSPNRDYWSETIGVKVSSYVSINANGFYGEYLDEGAFEGNTHVVLGLRQDQPGILDLSKVKIAPVFDDGTVGTPVAYSDIEDLPTLGSSWLNVTIPFSAIYDGDGVVTGYKLINEGNVSIAINKSFLSYLGDYEVTSYPLLDLQNILIYDDFNRATIGTTPVWSADNEIALQNGFTYLISYGGMHSSTIGDGFITFDSTGGDYVDYVVHSPSKGNNNQYRYLVFKYKLEGAGTLDNLRIQQKTNDDATLPTTVYANEFVAGLGLSSIPEDMSSYPYKDGDWTYLIVDLSLTPGLSTDFGGLTLYYTGSALSIDSMFFANDVNNVDLDSCFLWADFEGLEVGTADGKPSENQWWANIYDSAATIIAEENENLALQLDGTGYAQYHTGTKGSGRFLSLSLKVTTPGEFVSFRMATGSGDVIWAKDGDIILSNGLPMIVNEDGNWHSYVIDLLASGLPISDTVGFHASNGEVYLLDNLAWLNEKPYFEEELVWGDWEWAEVGNADGQAGSNQYWMNNYGSATSIVEVEGNKLLKLDATAGYVQIHTAVMAKPYYVAFDITVEVAGSLGINLGGVHKWNEELIGLDGNPIVLPAAGETAHIVIDVLLSGLLASDEFGIEANDGAIFYIDNVSFQWNNTKQGMNTIFEEDFDAPLAGNENYWWASGEPVDGVVSLVTAEYTTLRFGSPLLAGANFITFDVKLVEGNNGDEFRLELGDGNIVLFSKLVEDGFAVKLTEDYQTVTVDLSTYVADLNGLQVIGFHINAGGVNVDNLVFSLNDYSYQMSLFSEGIIE